MSILSTKQLTKQYGTEPNIVKALDGVSISIEPGEFVAIIGTSGSGKSTLLNMLGGLDRPTSGSVRVDNYELGKLKDEDLTVFRRQRIGFIFQNYNLVPVLNVYENIVMPIQLDGKKPDQKFIKEIVALLGLEKKLYNMPNTLSGGQQQRVAIARAIASEPHLLLMDEPLSNLDAKLRVDMRSELKRLHIETGTTMIYVTHDQVEALTMSTKIAIFKEGVIVQVDHPLELYNNPVNLYVADFIGNPSINFADGKAEVGPDGMTVTSPLGKMVFPKKDLTDMLPKEKSFDAVLGIRPEQVSINTTRQSPSDIEAHIYTSMPAGSETLVTVKVGGVSLVIKALGITHYNPDQVVYLSIDLNKINVFDKKSTNLIKYSV